MKTHKTFAAFAAATLLGTIGAVAIGAGSAGANNGTVTDATCTSQTTASITGSTNSFNADETRDIVGTSSNVVVGKVSVTGNTNFTLTVTFAKPQTGSVGVDLTVQNGDQVTGHVSPSSVSIDFGKCAPTSSSVASVAHATFAPYCQDGFAGVDATITVTGPDPGTELDLVVQGETTPLPWEDGTFGQGFVSGFAGDQVLAKVTLGGSTVDSALVTIPVCGDNTTTTTAAVTTTTTTAPATTTTTTGATTTTTTAAATTTTTGATTTTASVLPTTVAPTTSVSQSPPALPRTGGSLKLLWFGLLALVAGAALLLITRRRANNVVS